MVDFFEALHSFMKKDRELSKEVEDRIYPLLSSQEPLVPNIIYTPITCNYDENLQQESGFVRQIVQFTIHHTTFGKVRKTSRILRHLFKDFSGDMCGIDIQAIHPLNDMSIGTDDLAKEYMWVIELEFQYMEE